MSSAKFLDEESDKKWRAERDVERQPKPLESLYPRCSMSVTGGKVNEWLEVETILYWQSSEGSDSSTERARARARALAERQGVKPIRSIEDLRGDFWPQEESADEFLAWLRTTRQEGPQRSLPE